MIRLRTIRYAGALAVALVFVMEPGAAQKAKPAAKPAARPLPVIERDAAALPPRVAAMREAIMEAARSGDPEKLRLVLQRNEVPPILAKGHTGDPIAGLKARSGDGEGRETLAILLDILDAPYVHIDAGMPQDMYLWPWFAAYPPSRLDAEQLVEVYRVTPAREFKDSLARDKYLFYRLGIGPDGTWHYFFAGE